MWTDVFDAGEVFGKSVWEAVLCNGEDKDSAAKLPMFESQPCLSLAV